MNPDREAALWKTTVALFVLVILLALGGCATTTHTTVCPPVTPWTAEEQAQAADELDAPPPKPMLGAMLRDYALTRDRLRTCQ